MYKRILVPIDGSAIASHALDDALKLAREHDAELQPLYVVDMPPVSGGERAPPSMSHPRSVREGRPARARRRRRDDAAGGR